MLGMVYGLMFQDLLEYPVTLIYMYYEWAIYDLEFRVYIQSATMSV